MGDARSLEMRWEHLWRFFDGKLHRPLSPEEQEEYERRDRFDERRRARSMAERCGLAVMDRDGVDIAKLAKCLGMMSSDQEGEVLNAARAVEQERKRLGKTW